MSHIGELEEWLADLPDSYVSRVDVDPKFSHQTLVPYCVTFTADLSVKDKGKLGFSIAIDQTMLEYTPRVQDTFPLCSRLIVEVVETLEAFVETI